MPQAHEDDAERAVRAALELVDERRVGRDGFDRRCLLAAAAALVLPVLIRGRTPLLDGLGALICGDAVQPWPRYIR